MLDINFIRNNKDKVKQTASDKGVQVDIDELIRLDDERREIIPKAETLRADRNELAASMGQGKPSDEQIEQGKKLKEELAGIEKELGLIEDSIYQIARRVPNVVSEDTPVGKDEDENVVVKTVGEKPEFDFEPKPHWELLEPKGMIDKERAAKVSGARFAYHIGDIVELELAVQQFVIDVVKDEELIGSIIKEKGLNISNKAFTLVTPPEIVRVDVMEKTGRLDPPEDKYHVAGEDMVFVGSAEQSVGPMHMDEIIDTEKLPIRYLGISTAFRKEAGTYGKDTRGMIRVHQFRKLELETFSTPETSADEQELMVGLQEHIHRQLNLPYQVMMICTGDMGKPDYRQIDLNTWFPGEQKYRETTTSDHVSDFQARRLNIRHRTDNGNEFVHMNDATALSERPIWAIVENNQTADGQINVPEVLRPYMGGKAVI